MGFINYMYNIQVFHKPSEPVDTSSLEVRLVEGDFSLDISNEDMFAIEEIWRRVKAEKGDKVFSKPGGLGTLVDTKQGVFTFRPTEFKHYLGVSLSFDEKLLDLSIYERMRISAVGAAVRFVDDNVFVHRRSYDATHCGGYLDSSVAGFVPLNNYGKFDFRKTVLDKLQRELGITEGNVRSMGLTAVHSSYAPDFSCMFDFVVDTNLESGAVSPEKLAIYPEFCFVPHSKLADFIIENYTRDRNLTSDGAFVLLASLDNDTFLGSVRELRKRNKPIDFGYLDNGRFAGQYPL